ncbi:tRNA pseudouridine(38-40) synthase TruA [Mongoliimonas terrestris]|uniref:tRNA pseudouridine(38-40) synthase TruA n=1 Tax=Mongoliimonas terrestris TaxID=1709001 RepID=UPI000949967D|nr:tRNA pseudouridine(38-40) synthase TruA [Mongoliimonas terrestris]
MPRYRIHVEYDGTPFVGWQRQADWAGESVQGLIETAIFHFTHERVTLKGAGRTDAGVHATGQVAHFDLAAPVRPGTIRDAANVHLRPWPVTIVDAEAVGDDFDARFSARRRHYVYRIFDRRAPPTLDRHLVWHVPKRLDAEAMHAAARRLLGHHDFTTFRSTHCQSASPMKTLDRLDVVRAGDEIRVLTDARSFLHNQVRSMVGSLRKVGDGSWTADDIAAALKAADRTACGPVAPAAGLCLVQVDY